MRHLERGAWALAGLLLLAGVLLSWIGPQLARQAIPAPVPLAAEMDAATDMGAAPEAQALPGPAPAAPAARATRIPDARADWSTSRVRAWKAALAQRSSFAPTAAMRIPRLGIEAAVFPGTGDVALDLGVGHVEGTASPGSAGNFAVAGHRDGLFRRLEHVRRGDAIEVRDRSGRSFTYRVASTRVVDPEDTHVLDDTGEASITLVTCYPFRFLGNAPQRFVVRGVLAH